VGMCPTLSRMFVTFMSSFLHTRIHRLQHEVRHSFQINRTNRIPDNEPESVVMIPDEGPAGLCPAEVQQRFEGFLQRSTASVHQEDSELSQQQGTDKPLTV